MSVGFTYSFLFGNQFLMNELYTYDVNIDSVNSGLILGFIYEGNTELYAKAENGMMTEVSNNRKFSGWRLYLLYLSCGYS